MFQNKIFQIFSLITAIILSLYIGYLYGNRDFVVNQTPIEISTQYDNGYKENFFSDMKIADVQGFANAKDIINFGKMYYKIQNSKTYIKIDLNKLPKNLTNANIDKTIPLPTSFSVELARDNTDKTDFEYTNIGKIELSQNENGELNGSFATNFDFDINRESNLGLRRIIIKATQSELTNIFTDTDPVLPIKVRGDAGVNIESQPAPYFWIKF